MTPEPPGRCNACAITLPFRRCTLLAPHPGACWFPVETRRRPRWWLEQADARNEALS